MSTTEATSSPPSKSRVLTPDEADRIADSIRPSWESSPPSMRLATAATDVAPAVPEARVEPTAVKVSVAPAVNPVDENSGTNARSKAADPLAATAPGTADRTLTNEELRALERSKRLRSVPESSYREERSPSAPPERVEQPVPEASIIVDPGVLAAPPPQFAASPRVPADLRSSAVATPSADATVVIAPVEVAGLRPKRTGVLVAFGAVAAIVVGGIYVATQRDVIGHTPAAQPPSEATASAKSTPTTPAAPPPPPVATEKPVALAPSDPVQTKPEPVTKPAADAPKRDRGTVAAKQPETPPGQPPPAKPPAAKQPPASGGDKGKLVRDVPF